MQIHLSFLWRSAGWLFILGLIWLLSPREISAEESRKMAASQAREIPAVEVFTSGTWDQICVTTSVPVLSKSTGRPWLWTYYTLTDPEEDNAWILLKSASGTEVVELSQRALPVLAAPFASKDISGNSLKPVACANRTSAVFRTALSGKGIPFHLLLEKPD